MRLRTSNHLIRSPMPWRNRLAQSGNAGRFWRRQRVINKAALIALKDLRPNYLLIGKIGATRVFELAQAVVALLEHAVQHADDIVIAQSFALVDLEALDFGIHQAQRRHPLFCTGLHRHLGGLSNLSLEVPHLCNTEG